MGVTVASAYLASLSIEAFLNGIFFTLFCLSTYVMVARHHAMGRRSFKVVLRDPLFVAGMLMEGMAMAHLSLAIYRSVRAFIQRKLGTPELYYSSLQKASPVAETALVVGTLVTGNFILSYRMWKIWNHKLYAMVIPVASYVSAAACGIALVVAERRYRPADSRSGHEVTIWLLGAFISDIFANVTSSGLIMWKLWRAAARHIQRTPGSRRIYWLISVFVESSILYVVWNILFTVIYTTSSPVWYAITDTWVAVCGISFALINVRVGLGYLFDVGQTAAGQRPEDVHRVALRPNAFAMITVTREVATDCDDPELIATTCVPSIDNHTLVLKSTERRMQ